MKHLLLITALIIAALFFYTINQTMAVDPPHSTVQTVQCSSCHLVHKAQGTSLTKEASNYQLCWSCHNVADIAQAKPFDATMPASPWTTHTGTSHRWDATMPSEDSPDNAYGLRWSTSLTNFKIQLKSFGDVVTCSVCHTVHGQAKTPWDPNAPAYTGAGTGWATPAGGRHFQRRDNDLTQMCEDCHYYRTTKWTTNVRTWTGNYQSHPVGKVFTNDTGRDVSDPSQFNDIPLEPAASGWTTQAGSRYEIDVDGNVTNNIVLDSSKKTRCMSCHGIHYTDSDSSTLDEP